MGARTNAVVGANGSGKTSLLEAIYYLGHAKSFRTLNSKILINNSTSEFLLFARLENSKTIGIQKSKNSEQLKLSKSNISTKAELVRALPTQIINPDVHKILEDSPRYRRRFIDWGVFHVEHSYLEHWKNFQRILKQRNAALKKHWDRQLIAEWDRELINVGLVITSIKEQYVEDLQAEIKNIQLGFDDISISYAKGWPEDLSYEECLHRSLAQDQKTGFTKFGPHRADVKIKLSDYPAKELVSRGQQKYLACLLKIAQVILFHRKTSRYPVLLLDDLFSELDKHSAKKITDLVSTLDCQRFITSIEKHNFDGLLNKQMKMFHVEHGKFQEVV